MIDMKGFDIEIKNNLLERKHFVAMGMSVWLYMWLIDRMTSIGEDEIGLVLGGKPIKYDEIKKEFGISQSTYTRWIDQLEKYPYIKAIRTPYGISYRVFKAHKRFKKRIPKNDASSSPQMTYQSTENDESNKTDTIRDNTVDLPPMAGEKEIMEAFRAVNPSIDLLFRRTNQRQALRRMAELMGEDGLLKMVQFLPKNNTTPYAHKATTPLQLEANLGMIRAFWMQRKEMSSKNSVVIIP
jgi:hypothetical protein